MKQLYVLYILIGVLASISEILSQTNPNNVVSENSQQLQRRPVLSDLNRPARQQRPPQAGFGSLLSGNIIGQTILKCILW